MLPQPQQARRWASTSPFDSDNQPQEEIRAAPPIDFQNDKTGAAAEAEMDDLEGEATSASYAKIMDRLRIIPASPSYFTGKPDFTDDLLMLESLQRKYQTLPVLPTGQAPRVAWKTLAQYKVGSNEPVKAARYTKILQVLQRLNYIHPNLMPDEVKYALRRYMRDVQPFHNQAKPVLVDEYGRARGVGRRKSSNAVAYLVEGEGEVLINDKPLTEAFGRLHDRESALWALKATQRLDKYNVWAVARGGGTTGQADAIALAVSKALMVHEPMLKPALRRGEFSHIFCSSVIMLTRYHSRCCHKRSPPSGEKEARQAQGPQNARLGQALIVLLLHPFLTLYICTKLSISSNLHLYIPAR